MGEVVGAGLLAHVPTIMLDESVRRSLNEGRDSTLVAGLQDLRRSVFEVLDYDTVVVFDSHWATTVEFVVASQARRAGLFTSDELPRGMCRIPYDFPGDAELAVGLAACGDGQGTFITAIDDPYLPIHYATINLWCYLGVADKAWMSVSVCQSGDAEDHLRVGRALREALGQLDRKVILVASGALSHTFWPLRQIRDHEAGGVEHIFTPEAARADLERISWLEAGRHDKVIDTMADYARFKPEARFAHYMMMLGVLGERSCSAPARRYGDYENSVGTGQVHLWFDRPGDGWQAQRGKERG
jgi:3,4-dihydroxyphenylacetate 2,3-dioxygenase